MRKLRWLRLWSSVAAVTAGLVVATGTPARAGTGGDQGPQLLTVAPPLLVTGVPRWVELRWLTGAPVCDFRLTASSTPAVRIGYPSNTGTFSSFYRSDELGGLRSDYTSIHITAGEPGSVPLSLHVTYRQATAGRCAAGTGPLVVRTIQTRLGVLAAP
jgi:hypothetical protein